MKNRFFAVLLVGLVGTTQSNDDIAHLAVSLAQIGTEVYVADQKQQQSLPNEKNFRKRLYWLFEHNPFFYKLDDFQKNFDYYIATLTAHIKTLEGKIELKQSGIKSAALRAGLAISTLSALCSYGTYFFLKLRKDLQAGIYADRFVSSLQKEHAQELMLAAVSCGLTSAVFAAVAGNKFYKASRYAERQIERLERDKKLLAVLEQEKAALEAQKANNAADEAINTVVNCITTAIDKVVQGIAAASQQAVVPATDASPETL